MAPDETQDEKQDEQEQEKRDEKGSRLDRKYRRDPLGYVAFALLVVWLGVTLLLGNAGVYGADGSPNRDAHQWAVFAWGGGALVLAEVLVRLAVPRFRRRIMSGFVWAAIWVGVGFGLWFDRWEVIGPLVIIAVGVAILVGRFVPRSEKR